MKFDLKRKVTLLLTFILFLPLVVFSHNPNQSYIFIRIHEADGIHGRFEINTREVNKIFGTDFDDSATLEDIKPYIEDIKAYMLKHSKFTSVKGQHKVIFGDVGLFQFNLGDFVQLYFQLENTRKMPNELTVTYNPVFEIDDTHRGYLVTEYNWRAGVINEESNITLDFTPGNDTDTMDMTKSSVWPGIIAMVKQGIWHIWIGIDHILFLLALILPAVVRRRNNSIYGWEPVLKFKTAFIYIVKVITFFTIAHTITLTLATLKLVNLPSQIVESIIAFSIGLAAFHNVKPIFKMKDWMIAFIFGLFHGFGFASVLGDLGLTGEFLTLSLLGFNVGVEIGQLVIIAAIFPLLYLIRKNNFYPRFLVIVSIALILISLYWFIERAFNINLVLDEYLFKIVYNTVKLLGLK